MACTSPKRDSVARAAFARVGLAGADHHAGAGLQESAGHHQSDTSGAAGDQGALTGQIE